MIFFLCLSAAKITAQEREETVLTVQFPYFNSSNRYSGSTVEVTLDHEIIRGAIREHNKNVTAVGRLSLNEAQVLLVKSVSVFSLPMDISLTIEESDYLLNCVLFVHLYNSGKHLFYGEYCDGPGLRFKIRDARITGSPLRGPMGVTARILESNQRGRMTPRSESSSIEFYRSLRLLPISFTRGPSDLERPEVVTIKARGEKLMGFNIEIDRQKLVASLQDQNPNVERVFPNPVISFGEASQSLQVTSFIFGFSFSATIGGEHYLNIPCYLYINTSLRFSSSINRCVHPDFDPQYMSHEIAEFEPSSGIISVTYPVEDGILIIPDDSLPENW